MSKISISGAATGTATFTIESPATNTNRTLTLPDNTGTIITSGTTTGIDASALSTGTVAAARLPAGSVLQVVQGTFATQSVSSSAAVWVDTGLTASITPSNASNKILVIASLPLRNGSTSDTNIRTTIFRSSTNIGNADFGFGILKTFDTPVHAIMTMNFLDSPATTSSTAYKVSVFPDGQTAQWCGGSSIAVITLMEIAA